MTLTDELSAIAGEAFAGEGLESSLGLVRVSDRPDLAQFQCNGALAAAKAQKENPRALAARIAARLEATGMFSKVEIAGPGFINLSLRDETLAERANALAADARSGGWRREEPETIVIDYGGPNVAKPLHVGHLRSAIIGESLKRLLRFVGDEAVGDIHLGDWGLQMGQLISELERRRPDLPYFQEGANGPFPSEPPLTLADLEEMYPTASAACKSDPARAEEARKATAALQAGRPGYRALWRHFVDLSVAALKRDYDDLGVSFDLWKGEADMDPLIPDLVEDLKSKGLVEESEGAQIIRVAREDDKKETPPVILVNSQGAVGYHATDIATIQDRVRNIHPDRMLYVVDQRQRLHFEQVFRVADRAGIFPESRLEHLWFGTMNGKDGKPFKTRAGDVLKLRDLIDMVETRARERLEESGFAEGFGEAERLDIAHKIGVAALKFADLSNPRTSDYVFDLDRFLAFEGKTGPYLLYAVVRVRSVEAKARAVGAGAPGDIVITAPEERELALALLAFGDAVRAAYEKRMPHHLCDHAFRLAQSFSKFYAACRIADEPDDRIRSSRLRFSATVAAQLGCALDILGLEAPARM
ncbi:MAG: arginine--tRNA ligase [Alphaproteobacteria bacterium]|nr:arginine--tRNA ligase [Alphaproteobacteria bacterium]